MDIYERKPREAAEHEGIPDTFQTRKRLYVESHYTLQLRLRKETTLCFGTLETLAGKRVVAYPLVCDGILYHVLQVSEIAHGGVVGTFLAHAKKMLEVLNETCRNIFYRNILLATVERHELLEISHATLPAAERGISYVAALIFLAAFDVGLTEHVTEHLGLLHHPEIMVFHYLRIDELPFVYQAVVYFVETGAYHFKILVKLDVTTGAAVASLGALVPYRRIDLAADCKLHLLPLGRDAGIERILSASCGAWLSRKESQGEKRIFHKVCGFNGYI